METLILNDGHIDKKLTRIAYEIYEEHPDDMSGEVVLAGIADGGYEIAKRLEQTLKKISPLKTTLLKVTVNKKAIEEEGGVKFDTKTDLSGKTIILVDDVLNTGKVLSYCMKTILSVSRGIKCLRVAVLVDRNHTLFPVKSDYTGLSVATTLQEHIEVNLKVKGKESVILKD